MTALFQSRLHSHGEDKCVYSPAAVWWAEFTSALLGFLWQKQTSSMQGAARPFFSYRSAETLNLNTSSCSRAAARRLHIQVLLGVLDVPLDFSIYVEVKLFGHRQRDQRSSLWIWFLTAEAQLFINEYARCKTKNPAIFQLIFYHNDPF